MDFQEFLQFVPKVLDVRLPAFDAHIKMAPLERSQSLKQIDFSNKNPRVAAVMMLFYPKNETTHLVLIVRNSYKGVHSAQIAFPGGKYEIDDKDFEYTALRETHEEVGIHPDKIQILKPFTQLYIPPSNFMVYPFLGISKEELVFVPQPSEVADIIELPLSIFLSDSIVVETKVLTSYSDESSVPAFKIENHIVWGATAMMLSELKEVLKKGLCS
ncbi:NUDIX hydrolase [Flavobacterium sandaracinum]|uniref:CoA pyrophosphatase n=1 Tax=Flavobacterium sandaracinum TaxID=2541733 RepID=A0A4R5CV47_9FLAO|nr:CoA pyrophosphatase [Flavobacterium sandaracinum]TDE01653.1 CoA pyrophosphatase [Flavobacterium sandaracinum]